MNLEFLLSSVKSGLYSTEVLEIKDKEAKWRKGRRLASNLAYGCATKVSPEEILVINQDQFYDIKVKSTILYNMVTGAMTWLKAPSWENVGNLN